MTEQMVAENLKLEAKRTIRADRARVFAAWTQPELIKKWFAPGTMTTPSASNDLRPGGEYRIEMERCEERKEGQHESKTSVATGVYKTIVPGELLVFTWRGSWDPEEETLVTVHFKDIAGGTELTLTHENFTTPNSLSGHEQGWAGSLAKLATTLEAS